MAVALGFGQGNKVTPMSGSTGGGQIQAKIQPNGQLGISTDGTGGLGGYAKQQALNYLKGLGSGAANGAAADYGGELAAGGGAAASGGW